MADASEIWITDDVWRYPGVQELLEPHPVEPRTAEFQGIERPMALLRVGSPSRAGKEPLRPAVERTAANGQPRAAKGPLR
jgi:hypothetical protein